MRIRTSSLALVVLLGSSLTGCLTGRQVEVAAGEYAPVLGAGVSGPALAIEAVRVDRDNQTAWFMLADGSQIIIPFSPLPRAEWPVGCPTNIYSTHMEVLEMETEALTIESTTFHRPVLIRNCPPDPVEIVLRSSGEVGGTGNACSGTGECITFETASSATSLPRSMKGYELYSWYVEEEDAWYYTLVTGTNRWKSYAEVSTPESVITADDWVKITVRGIDSLRSVLDLLPEGEIVIERDAGWLEAAPPPNTITPPGSWITYTNSVHRFSLRHPPGYDVPPADFSESRGFIGDQIAFSVADQDPYWLDCFFESLGDCPVMEQTELTRVGDPARNAIRISGFIGSIGGRIPQQYVTYLVREGGMYYTFTLYTLGRDSEIERVDVIWPLGEADIVAFEQMMETLTFQVGNMG